MPCVCVFSFQNFPFKLGDLGLNWWFALIGFMWGSHSVREKNQVLGWYSIWKNKILYYNSGCRFDGLI